MSPGPDHGNITPPTTPEPAALPMRQPANPACDGFTLLEVMVATAILCAGLAAIVSALGMAVQSTAISNGYEKARLVAENQLAAFLVEGLLLDREAKGRENGLEWRIKAQTNPGLPDLYDVEVAVDFRAGAAQRTLVLSTRQSGFELPPAELPAFPPLPTAEGEDAATEGDPGETAAPSPEAAE